MYDDEIKELNEWFTSNDRSYDTSFDGEWYVIGEYDVKDFCNFLRELNPNLLGFPCIVDTSGIWFRPSDLNKATYL